MSAENQYDYLFKLELRGKPIPESNLEKISLLEKRRKKIQGLLFANAVFVIVFFLSHQYGITNLSPIWLFALAGVFVLNLFMLFKQSKKVQEAILFFSK
jgi:hypothetical protein